MLLQSKNRIDLSCETPSAPTNIFQLLSIVKKQSLKTVWRILTRALNPALPLFEILPPHIGPLVITKGWESAWCVEVHQSSIDFNLAGWLHHGEAVLCARIGVGCDGCSDHSLGKRSGSLQPTMAMTTIRSSAFAFARSALMAMFRSLSM